MAKGKQIKVLPTPDFNQPLTLKLIGQAVKARRTQQGLDTKTAAMLCNVSTVTLNKIENAFDGVRISSVLKVMRALGIEMHLQPWEQDG